MADLPDPGASRALIVYCHPSPASFTAAVLDVVLAELRAAGAAVRVHDLYAEAFAPVLTAAEHRDYADAPANCAPVARETADLAWCDTLLFVYPTWWYGLPAMAKGWLDRVLLPGTAFLMPDATHRSIRPGLRHVRRLGVFTTCGASRWLTAFVGAPGRRTLLRGVRLLCARDCRTAFAALYRMDTVTPADRAAHLARVGRSVRGLAGRSAA